jgi:hypothetical protein
MATESQNNANRSNAQHSTGPRTEAGKANSSRNHLTLGLYTRQDYVKPDERDLYKHFCETMHDELAPQTLLQESLVSEITGATWRLRRCSNVEGELADYAPCDPMLDEKTDKTRRSLERARATAHSIVHRSLNQLRKLRKDRTDLEKRDLRLVKQTQQAEMDALDMTLSSIMNCPEPDWDRIDRELAAEQAASVQARSERSGLIPTEPQSQGNVSGQEAEALSIQPTPFPEDDDPELASNCEAARPYRHEGGIEDVLSGSVGSNCQRTQTPPLVAALIKRNLPCACGSRIIYRECCGKNEPRDWKQAA